MTSDEEANFGEFANPRGRQIGERKWQSNYRGEDEYELKVDTRIKRLNLLLID